MTFPPSSEGVRRVGILHFTARPAVGGIESLMDAQCRVLTAQGHNPICVVGSGAGPRGTHTAQIPAMRPNDPGVPWVASEEALQGAQHPLVQRLVVDLQRALVDCTDCWVHNALTVTLNPFLTAALLLLVRQRRDLRWVAWTADLSAVSDFVGESRRRHGTGATEVRDLLTWVAISQARAADLERALGVPVERIHVIPSPLDIPAWLDWGRQTRRLEEVIGLLDAEPLVLVPAKALPHKGLDRAVGAAVHLVQSSPRARVLITAATSPHEPAESNRVRRALQKHIGSHGMESHVVLLPEILRAEPSARTVRELMILSDVVLVPSLEEGFGVPLREAAAVGVPVVCTDISVFREVGGPDVSYFAPDAGDEQVAGLVSAAARTRRTPARNAALRSMSRFQGEIEELLRNTAQPKV